MHLGKQLKASEFALLHGKSPGAKATVKSGILDVDILTEGLVIDVLRSVIDYGIVEVCRELTGCGKYTFLCRWFSGDESFVFVAGIPCGRIG